MAEPNIVTVRTLLTHFRSTLQTARQTGEPVIIALRRRSPAGVLLGYETWQAGQAELAAAHQRVAELEARLARPQPSAEVGATWSVTPASAAPASSPATGLSWGSTAASASPAPPAPPVTSGWGRS